MINPFAEVNWNPGNPERRKFGRTLLLGLPVVAMLLALLKRVISGHWHWEATLWIAGLGVTLGLISLLLPALAKPVYVIWHAVGCGIGFIINNLLLVVCFYLAFTPLGLLKRVLGKRQFEKSFQKQVPTYWKEAPRSCDPQRYYNQF